MKIAKSLQAHLPAAVVFGAFAIAWTFPLILHLSTHVPGSGPGDNLSFVWNLWWFRTALDAHIDPFFTTYLFFPLGVDLAQHSHTALNGIIAASLLRPLSVVTAQNVLLLVWVFLNGFLAYVLAFRLCGSRVGALGAGIVFGGTPAIFVRLAGHFNLVAGWVLPLSALLVLRAIDRKNWRTFAAVGAAWAVAAYCDYYYLIYSLACAGLLYAAHWFDASIHANRRRGTWLSAALTCLLAADVLLIVIVTITGGFEWQWSGIHVSMRTTFNLKVAFWALAACWLLSRWRVSIGFVRRNGIRIRSDLAGIAIASAVFVCAILPLAVHAARLVTSGDYASQHYYWRSAPAGVDLASVVLGNPLHILSGSLTRSAYQSFGLNPMEGVGWIGIVAPLVVILGWRHLARTNEARPWRAAGILFGLWALGPFLTVFGAMSGAVLPATIIRFIPIVSNARIPGRAMVSVALALAVLAALAITRMSQTWSSARKAGILALLLFDCATGPLALYQPEANRIYAQIATSRLNGAVLELPLGVRDGFGETGHLDHRTLYYQTISGRPMTGGFVARLPESVKRWYGTTPLISTLLRLSSPAGQLSWTPPSSSRAEAFQVLVSLGIRYVVLDRQTAGPDLARYVDSTLPLMLVAEDSGRQLFEVRAPVGGDAETKRAGQ